MPYPLNNVTTAAAYADAATMIPPQPVPKVRLTISNAAALVQIERCDPGVKVGAGQFMPEEFMVPGVYGITREWPIGRIQFRSATTTNAQVSAAAATG